MEVLVAEFFGQQVCGGLMSFLTSRSSSLFSAQKANMFEGLRPMHGPLM